MNRDTDSALDNYARSNSGMIAFFSISALIFGTLYGIYSLYLFDTQLFLRYLELCARLATNLLQFFGEDVQLDYVKEIKAKITNEQGVKILVARGCDASIVFAVLIAVVLAWPAPLMKKFLAAAVGLALMFFLNVVRIACMFEIELHRPEWFNFMHIWIVPNLLIAGALLYFYLWTRIIGTHPMQGDAD